MVLASCAASYGVAGCESARCTLPHLDLDVNGVGRRMRRQSCLLRMDALRWVLSAEPAPCAVRRRHPPLCGATSCARSPYSRYVLARSRSRRALRTPPIEGSAATIRDVFHAPALRPLGRASSCKQHICRISSSAAVEDSKARATQFDLIVRPRLDRTSSDASICPTARRHRPSGPRIPSSGAAASSPWRLIPSQSNNSRTTPGRIQTGHPTVRVVLLCRHVPISPPRRDLTVHAPPLAAHAVSQAPLIRRTPTHPARGTPHCMSETTPCHHRLTAAE
ncbi:hypothetical protein B0H13DRAFT_1058051 [Mycena leptocephala]|nr:hypothetical protein B0H13DRAFT_1058051 [Mycena leptocephala]